MSFRELAAVALQSLLAHRLRSTLTVLGIIIGIASVISLMAIGEGAKSAAEKEISNLGTNLIFVTPGEALNNSISLGKGSAATLTYEDARAVGKYCSAVDLVAAQYGASFQLERGAVNTRTQVVGTDASFPDVRNFHPEHGRFFSDSEVQGCEAVCVLGKTVAATLFGDGAAVGSNLLIKGQAFTVIGVMEKKGSGPMGDSDDQVLVPISTGYLRLFGLNSVTGRTVKAIYIKTKDNASSEAQFQITNLIRLRHNIVGGKDDFLLGSQNEILQTAARITGLLSVLLSMTAGISLLVGAIGIMNIMLVTVNERTDEIGIRKAIGAKYKDIMTQFIMESVVLSMCGGILGVSIGVSFSLLFSAVAHFPPSVTLNSIILSFFLAFAVGLISGFYPARKAALMDPIVALRS